MPGESCCLLILEVLPDFELITFQPVQSIASNPVDFSTWFEALDWMCTQVEQIDFTTAIIGAGAYGFPLGAHIKRTRQESHPSWRGDPDTFWNSRKTLGCTSLFSGIIQRKLGATAAGRETGKLSDRRRRFLLVKIF